MIVLIDNYDSFTYNIFQVISDLTNEEIRVIRNDEIDLKGLRELNPSKLIISPGPGRPEEAGVSVEAIIAFGGKIPVLGVCLGHQAMAHAFGGRVVSAQRIVHGKTEPVSHDSRGLFRGLSPRGRFLPVTTPWPQKRPVCPTALRYPPAQPMGRSWESGIGILLWKECNSIPNP
jgi:anthranilate synthase/phosphoribosyltransferase